jgi:hypothetical protein
MSANEPIQPRVTKIVMYMTPRRKKPQEGDKKTVKGVEYVRKQVIARMPNGSPIGYMVRNGRPVFEWVKVT